MTDDVGTREYELTDDDGRNVVFAGRLLGEVTSEQPGKDRWTEIAIYVTEAGAYIVHVVGQSLRPGDRLKSKIAICETPQAVVGALHQVDGDGVVYLTQLARKAVATAGEREPELLNALAVQRVA